MARLESLTKNSALIIIVIFLLVMVIVFCNREKLSSSFVYQSEISKERKLDSIEQEGEETKVSSSPVAKAQEGEESKLSSSAERSEAGEERSSASPSTTARESENQESEETENQSESNWQWIDSQKKLYELSSTEIDSILEEVWQRFPEEEERLKALAILRLGTPYQLGCLGEEESGRDKDPIFRLDVTDCTAFVLTNVALLHSQTIDEAKETIKFLNYQPNSAITFENRLHFTTDRNAVSPYFRDITGENLCACKLKTKKVILNKVKSDGNRLIDIDWQKEIVLKYIPNEFITKDLFQNLPKTIGIAFIKEGDEEIGLDVRHEGFLFDGQFLFHATPNKMI